MIPPRISTNQRIENIQTMLLNYLNTYIYKHFDNKYHFYIVNCFLKKTYLSYLNK